MKRYAVELPGNVEDTVTNILQAKVGLELLLIKVVAFLPDLFGVIPPVPGGQLKVIALQLNPLLQVRSFLGDFLLAGCPDLVKQFPNRRRRPGHPVIRHELTVGSKAKQAGSLSAEGHNALYDRLVIHAAGPATCICPVNLLPQFPSVRILQERGDRRPGDRKHKLTWLTPGLSLRTSGIQNEIRQARQVVSIL